jgi:NAD-dependent SIR2 family protein deacetylase
LDNELSNRNVFILGAGFSAAAGAPVVRDFLDCARQFYDDPSSGLDGHEREHFRKVFEFKRTVAQAREKINIDLDDIEQLFGLVEMSQRLGDVDSDTRYSTVYLIAKTLELATRRKRGQVVFPAAGLGGSALQLRDTVTHSNPSVGPTFSSDIYSFFANLIRGELDDPDKRKSRRDTVITFNYDLILDHALSRTGGLPSYHLPPSLLADPPGEQVNSVSVLKLHGSTNWGICVNCMKSIVVLDEKVTASPAEFRSLTCRKCQKVRYQPLLVPPSWDKSEYRDIMQPVWARAVNELRAATRIIVIGYSMPETDAFFKYLITLGLAGNHQLYKFILVDISAEVATKFENLLVPIFRHRRFKFFGSGFPQFLHQMDLGRDLGRAEAINGGIQFYGP